MEKENENTNKKLKIYIADTDEKKALINYFATSEKFNLVGSSTNGHVVIEECKNLKPNYPLVISCTPRIEQEQKIDVWHWGSNAQYERQFCCPTSFYQLNGWVGRSLDQVGKDSNSDLIIEDNSTYDKWTQALASLHGMLEDALSYNASDGYDYLVFLPLIVVPDGTLWQINYSAEGQRAGDPKQVDSVNFWIDVEYLIKHDSRSEYYNISHLHFLTKKGLINFLNNEPVLLNAFCRY